jgi:hypothetical protein
MRAAIPFVAILPALAACGPISVEQVERDCLQRARGAAHPTGFVEAGIGHHGARGAVEIDINSDYLSGKDPAALYNACVTRKTGQPPRQPLYTRPDWKG